MANGKAGAPLGNKNAEKGKRFALAIEQAIEEKSSNHPESKADKWFALKQVACALVDKALTGDVQAIKEVRDTLDGKPSQQVAVTDSDGGPLQVIIKAYELTDT